MTRRAAVSAVSLLLAGCAASEDVAPSDSDLEAAARAIHESAFAADVPDEAFGFETPIGGAMGADRAIEPEVVAAAVERLNMRGVLVDVSHLPGGTRLHVMRVSRAPVVASGSNVRALADHPSNLDDEALLALRDNGGVIQIVAIDTLLKVHPPERAAELAELQEAWGYEGGGEGMSHEQKYQYDLGLQELDRRYPPADVSAFLDHIDHAVGLIGIDHVGIGSDFHVGGGALGSRDASETFAVTLELVRRGYTEADIRKLSGGNLLRVWRAVERVASELNG